MSKDSVDGVVPPIMALAVVAALGACAETEAGRDERSRRRPRPRCRSRRLLQRGTSGEVSEVYLNPGAALGLLHQGHAGPRDHLDGAGLRHGQGSPKEQKALADAFFTELHDAVAKRCQMVTEPSPGTMRWHIALVDATSANPFLNTISTYEPHIHLLDVAAGYAFDHGVAYWVGEATAGRLRQGCDDRNAALGRRGRARRHQGLGPGYLQLLGRRRQRLQGVGRAVRQEA